MEKLIFFKKLFKRKNKIVIYTAIFGNYDLLKEQKIKFEGCDYYCFTDNKNLQSNTFKVIFVKSNFNDNNRNAKIYKILPHKFFARYKYSIWIDGSIEIKNFDLKKMINKFLKSNNIAFFKHPDRDFIYEELNSCIDLKKDDIKIMINQINRYKSEGYPSHNGLIAGAVILRRHNHPEIINLDENWWNEITKYSKRDQLSFNYVAWKNKINYNVINEIIWNNKYFRVLEHNN